MRDGTPRGNVYTFPTPTGHRVHHAAIRAVRLLASKGLVTESEAVRSLREWDAPEAEIELVRTLAALRRRRVS